MPETPQSPATPALTRYTYHGPQTGLTLAGDAGRVEHVLHDGAEYDLPADAPEVETLVALKRLTPPTAGAPPAPSSVAPPRPRRAAPAQEP